MKAVEGAEANPADTVFEPQNSYVMISLHLQDQLFPNNDGQGEVDLSLKQNFNQELPETKKLPSSYDAIDDFNSQLDFIAKEISAEYTRMFNGD